MQFLPKVVAPHICKMHKLVKLPLLLQKTGSRTISRYILTSMHVTLCPYTCPELRLFQGGLKEDLIRQHGNFDNFVKVSIHVLSGKIFSTWGWDVLSFLCGWPPLTNSLENHQVLLYHSKSHLHLTLKVLVTTVDALGHCQAGLLQQSGRGWGM